MENKLWSVVSFNKGFIPKSVKRLSDNLVFSIGDIVTNGTKMKGKIEKFDFERSENDKTPDEERDIYVYTDWSGIGMNLKSLSHVKKEEQNQKIKLPSAFQIGDVCGVKFGEKADTIGAQVIKISFTESKVLYDVEIGVGKKSVTRLHSVDSVFIVSLG